MQDQKQNFEHHDLPATEMKTPAKGKGCGRGCIGCLAFAIAVPVLLLWLGYATIFHSSTPLKWVANAMTEDDPSFAMHGVSGSIAKGFEIEKIEFQVKNDGETNSSAETSTIEGLTFKYGGLWRSIRKEELVIKELSADRMDITFPNDYFTSLKDDSDDAVTEEEGGTDIETVDGSETNDSLNRFEIRELSFANNRFRTPDGKTDISIPLFRMTGLKIEGDDFELKSLEVESDCLVLNLLDAEPAEVEGHMIPYKRKIIGKVLPKIHDLVKAPIDFEIDFASIDGETKSRVTACNGAIRVANLPDGSSIMHLTRLTIPDYVDCSGHITPERFTVTARQDDDVVKFERGELYLGKTRFVIDAQEMAAEGDEDSLLSIAKVNGQTVHLGLRSNKDNSLPPFLATLEYSKAIPDRELLASIYFQRAHAELTSAEKDRVETLLEHATIKPLKGK